MDWESYIQRLADTRAEYDGAFSAQRAAAEKDLAELEAQELEVVHEYLKKNSKEGTGTDERPDGDEQLEGAVEGQPSHNNGPSS